jgi:hypothetical protein
MSAPGYWQHETSGVLRPVVEAYLVSDRLTPDQIATMRAYLRQWIMSPVWDANPHGGHGALAALRERIDTLTTQNAIDRWIDDADALGFDPL